MKDNCNRKLHDGTRLPKYISTEFQFHFPPRHDHFTNKKQTIRDDHLKKKKKTYKNKNWSWKMILGKEKCK